jgi:dihydrofolate synthase / folylpolyglutamate synthase
MNITEAIDFIHSTRKLGSKLGLANIRNLMNHLGNPHRDLRIIHVAGTNGKGSVCAYLSNILKSAGYRTGLFTSPDIEVYNERIQINNENIPDDQLVKLVEVIKEVITRILSEGMNHPTEFEINTAMALLYFKEQGCDAVVWETGLGGRLDSTNVIEKPVVSVITALGYDHMNLLGDTIEKIAYEKACIIKEKCPVVVYGDNPPRQ